MAVRLLSTFDALVAPYVPGCPPPTILHHVRNAIIDVCERTLVWRFEMPRIRLTNTIYLYDYELPHQTQVAGIIHSVMNGNPLPPITQERLHTMYPSWPNGPTSEHSQPLYLSQLDVDHFVVAPVPDDDTTYDVDLVLALKPDRTATEADDTVLDDIEQIVVHGALQTLFSIPEKSWTSIDMSTYHARQFASKIGIRRAVTNIGSARASLSARMQPFA